MLKANFFVVVFIVSAFAESQENENAVPLLLGLESEGIDLEKISVRIIGREVTVSTRLRNHEASAKKIGWYASTPQFSILGMGEEHLDKSFSDVRSTVNGKMIKAMVYQRGYFMGRDITSELILHGLGPLPNLNYDAKKLARVGRFNMMRSHSWQGYANYAWSAMLLPKLSTTVEVSYRALPAFALTDISSEKFAYAVRQHCGEELIVREHVQSVAGAISQVIIESYEVPIAYALMQEVDVNVVVPHTNWLHAHPVVSMACGLQNKAQLANAGGAISVTNGGISILVVSAPQKLAPVGEEKNGL